MHTLYSAQPPTIEALLLCPILDSLEIVYEYVCMFVIMSMFILIIQIISFFPPARYVEFMLVRLQCRIEIDMVLYNAGSFFDVALNDKITDVER